MKSLLLWAGIGAIIGHFFEIVTLISRRPTGLDESILLTDMGADSAILFAFPIIGALIAIALYQITRIFIR